MYTTNKTLIKLFYILFNSVSHEHMHRTKMELFPQNDKKKNEQSVEFLNQSLLKPSGNISIRKSTRLQFIVAVVSTCFGPLGQTAHWTTQAAPAWHHASVLLQYLQAGNNCHCYGLFTLNYNCCNVPQPTQILCLNSCPQFSLPHKKLAVF